MKSLICFIAFVCCFLISKGQYPVTQNLGSSSTLVTVPANGGLLAGVVLRSFTDTVAANLTNLKYYDGALIKTTSPIAAIWYRNLATYQWIQIFPAGGGGTASNAWTTRGNDLSSQSLPNRLGLTNGDQLNIITNNLIRMVIPAGGIVRSSSAQNKYLVMDTVGKEIYYTDAGGTTPTWQQTLTSGSTLNQDNTIAGGGFDFTWNNTDNLSFNTVGSFSSQSSSCGLITNLSNSGASIVLQASSSAGSSFIRQYFDTLKIEPNLGNIVIDTLANLSAQNTLIGWTTTSGANRGKVGYITLAGSLSLAGGVLTGTGITGLTVGTTTIASGNTTRILYDNAGVLGEYTLTGTGTVVAMGTSPDILTSLTTSSATFALLNTTATTLTFAGAATTLTIGGTTTSAITHNYSTNATATATTKTLNIGTGGAASSTTNINIGDADGGTTTINSPTLAIATAATIGGITVPTISSTNTLTNKRWTARVGSTTSSATPTINTDNTDIYKLTAQTADITSMTSNLSGTPVDGDILEIQITGTAARAITWGASFVSSTVTLPATTVTTATLTVILQYYTTSSYGNNKWVCTNYY